MTYLVAVTFREWCSTIFIETDVWIPCTEYSHICESNCEQAAVSNRLKS